MPSAQILVLGTGNRGKVRELLELLADVDPRIQSLADFPPAPPVDETGDSFQANAELKASAYARHLRQWVLGEDSGLSVDALGGAPGIYSARFAGPNATDHANNQRLLAELGDRPPERRAAHYVCHVAVADPAGTIRAGCEARCHGRIRTRETGSSGFGYDPLFEIIEAHRTFAELGDVVKTVLSHRARAVRRLIPKIRELCPGGQWERARGASDLRTEIE